MSNHRLRIVCVGTGRDGTTSLTQMIQRAYDAEGAGRRAFHEWLSVYFYNSWCDYRENGDEQALDLVRQAWSECNMDCVVGNGYAPVLSQVAEVVGRDVVLVHLKRRDRDACVRSLVRNAELFPANHRYYADSAAATGKRMAAFHFGEASAEEWSTWSLTRKFEWYYDKTHALVERAKPLFDRCIEIETESLELPETRERLAEIAGLGVVPPAVHVNRHFELDSLPEQPRAWAQSALGRLDVLRFGDHFYGARHFLEVFLQWADWRMERLAATHDLPEKERVELTPTLADARDFLSEGLLRLQGHLDRLDRDGIAGMSQSAARATLLSRGDDLVARLDKALSERSAAVQERERVVSDKERLGIEVERLREELKLRAAERAILVAEGERLSADRDRISASHHEMALAHARLVAESNRIIVERSRAEAERSVAEFERQDLARQVRHLEEEMSRLQASRDSLSEDVARFRASEEVLRTALNGLEEDVLKSRIRGAELEIDLARARDERNAACADIHRMLKSKSWRVTAPLRLLRAWMDPLVRRWAVRKALVSRNGDSHDAG